MKVYKIPAGGGGERYRGDTNYIFTYLGVLFH